MRSDTGFTLFVLVLLVPLLMVLSYVLFQLI